METPDINPFLPDSFEQFKRYLFDEQNSTPSASIATVVNVSATNKSCVDIQPSVKYFDKNTGFTTYPKLLSVPVFQLAGSTHAISASIVPGDVGLVIWVDREIYSWLTSSSPIPAAPESGSLHNVNACVFIPCMQKFSQAPALQSSGMEFMSMGIKLMQELITMATNMGTFANSLVTAGSVPTFTWTPGAGGSAVSPAYQVQVTTAANTFVTQMTTTQTKFTTFKGSQP
jgi:hypothetical protein